jgi:anaerobic C4-dicarboxylate transporter
MGNRPLPKCIRGSEIALITICLSATFFSAAATVVIFVPLDLAPGLRPFHLIAFYLAANSIFVLPTCETLLAAVSFDQTGTTRIGKYLLNRSFMLPGMVTVVTGIIIALGLSSLVHI